MITTALLTLALSSSAQAATILSVNATTDELMVFDTTTAVSYSAGSLGFSYDFGDAAYDDALATMYIVVARPTPSLYAFNLTTGAFGLVANLTVNELFAADVDPSTGHILAIQNSTGDMYDIHPTTGVETFVYSVGVRADGGYWDDALDGLVVNPIGAQSYYLVSRTGLATFLGGSGGFVDNNDVDLDAASGQIWSFDWSTNIRSLSYPSFGLLTSAANTYASDALVIIDNVPPIPDPLMETVSGTCPGTIGIQGSYLTPGGQAAVLTGTGPGTFTIPVGVCTGYSVGLTAPRLLATVTVSPSGTISGTPTFNAAQCAKSYQIVDLTTCRVSNVYQP